MRSHIVPKGVPFDASLVDKLNSYMANPSGWMPPRALHRHLSSVEAQSAALASLLQSEAAKEVLRDIAMDPGEVWLPEDVKAYEAKAKGTKAWPLSDLVIGTAMFPETSSVKNVCRAHPSAHAKCVDPNCVMCVRHLIHITASDLFNHDVMFRSVGLNAATPEGQPPECVLKEFPTGFRDEFQLFARNHIASGWTWLVFNPRKKKVEIVNTPNSVCVLSLGMWPLLAIDMWEHAWAYTAEDLAEVSHTQAAPSPAPWSRAARTERKKQTDGRRAQDPPREWPYAVHSPRIEKDAYIRGFVDRIDWTFAASQFAAAKEWEGVRDGRIVQWDDAARARILLHAELSVQKVRVVAEEPSEIPQAPPPEAMPTGAEAAQPEQAEAPAPLPEATEASALLDAATTEGTEGDIGGMDGDMDPKPSSEAAGALAPDHVDHVPDHVPSVLTSAPTALRVVTALLGDDEAEEPRATFAPPPVPEATPTAVAAAAAAPLAVDVPPAPMTSIEQDLLNELESRPSSNS